MDTSYKEKYVDLSEEEKQVLLTSLSTYLHEFGDQLVAKRLQKELKLSIERTQKKGK